MFDQADIKAEQIVTFSPQSPEAPENILFFHKNVKTKSVIKAEISAPNCVKYFFKLKHLLLSK
jgi:hypothetical protein